MNIYTGSRYTGSSRAWYLFSHEHDIIETGPKFLEQKGNVWYIVQLTMCSTLVYYDICPPIARMCSRFCPHLPSLFLLFRVFRYAHAQLRTLCDLYPDTAHMRKNTRFSPPSACFNVCVLEAWELFGICTVLLKG